MQGYEDKSPEMRTARSSLQKYSFSGTDNMGKGGGQKIMNSKAKQRVAIKLSHHSDLMPQGPQVPKSLNQTYYCLCLLRHDHTNEEFKIKLWFDSSKA